MYISTGAGALNALPGGKIQVILGRMRPQLRAGAYDAAMEQAVIDVGLGLAGAGELHLRVALSISCARPCTACGQRCAHSMRQGAVIVSAAAGTGCVSCSSTLSVSFGHSRVGEQGHHIIQLTALFSWQGVLYEQHHSQFDPTLALLHGLRMS